MPEQSKRPSQDPKNCNPTANTMLQRFDKNFLLGLVALYQGKLDRQQLAAALQVCSEDQSEGLHQVLVAQHVISASEGQELLKLVEHNLAALTNEIARSNAYLQNDSIASNSAAEADQFSTIATDGIAEDVGERIQEGNSRFQVLRPHAKGGLGEVFVAVDKELHREVALKEIRSGHANQKSSRDRFLLEAEVTGGLEHPGIVPVYGLGQYKDGRPFYAMRFIRGDSLRVLIDRFHGADSQRKRNRLTPDFESAEFRKLLRSFVDVCYAVQYAHARGVLHRDLKPDNIMIGRYGETLIVDWGLAKLRQSIPSGQQGDSEPTLLPNSGCDSVPTQLGSALGTPAYMPPEQALGRLEDLGPACDIYSIGATLYHLLAGQPPFTQPGLAELLDCVKRGDFKPPRFVVTRVPLPLDAICQKAMSTDPKQRYSSPVELADEVERFLADEPVDAYPEPLRDRARRWLKKHRTIAATTAAVVLLTTIGLAGLSAVVSRNNSKLAAMNESLLLAEQAATRAKDSAETNAELALLHGELTFETLAAVVDDIQGGLEDLPGAGEVRRRLLRTSLQRLDRIVSTNLEPGKADKQRVIALFKMGDVILRFGAENADPGDPAYGESEELQQSAVGLARKFYNRAHRIALDLVDADPSNLEAQRNLATSYSKLGTVQLQAGKHEEAMKFYEDQLTISGQILASNPGDPTALRHHYVSNHRLGKLRVSTQEHQDALEAFKNCSELADRLVNESPKDSDYRRLQFVAYDLVGDVYLQLGNTEKAIELYRKSLGLKKELLESDPDLYELQHDLFISNIKFGKGHLLLGDTSHALAAFEQSVVLGKKLAEDDPNDFRAQRDLTFPLSKIADIHSASGNLQGALDYYLQVLEIDTQSSLRDPQDARVQLDLAISYQNVAETNRSLNDYAAARKSFRSGAKVAQHMLEYGMNSERATEYLQYFNRSAEDASKSVLAFGDWQELLTQPEPEVCELLERRATGLARKNELEAAVQAASELRSRQSVTAAQLLSAANVFRIAAFRSIAPELNEPAVVQAQQELRAKCRSELFQALQQAAKLGLKSVTLVPTGP